MTTSPHASFFPTAATTPAMAAAPAAQVSRYIPGLSGVVAARTAVSNVDGLEGVLTIGGYDVEVLAANATFEEAAFLLWNGRLPNPCELDLFRAQWDAASVLGEATIDAIDRLSLSSRSSQRLGIMETLIHAVTTLGIGKEAGQVGVGGGDGERVDSEEHVRLTIAAALPEMIARICRVRNGMAPEPDFEAGRGARRFLSLVRNRPCSAEEGRALEQYWLTVIDHGMNASTFAARVIVSTGSDDISAIAGALGAMKGPLHGGAPGPALQMVREIASLDRAEPYLRAKLDAGERLMGFGHRVYKVRDPRAAVLSGIVERLAQSGATDTGLLRLALGVEAEALRLLNEYKPGRNLRTNVEFFTALLLTSLSIPDELFTPLFSASRVVGWLAHCKEQRHTGKLMRPASEYTGSRYSRWPR